MRRALALVFLLAAAGCLPAEACTLWGAGGSSVAGGGTLIAKNRDWAPDHRQELAVLRPAEGYAALVLRAVGGREPGIKAGVNAKGLVIVSASANQVPSAERQKAPQKKQLMGQLLAGCASVEEVLQKAEWMVRPVFYLVADRRELALIEVGPDGRRAVTRHDAGALHHTNHYCAVNGPETSRRPGDSSIQRQARIAELLAGAGRPFRHEDFIRFSADMSAGPDNSIWRTGSALEKTRTLAAWIVSIPPAGTPTLYLRTADPGQPQRTCRFAVEEALRSAAGPVFLDGPTCQETPAAQASH
jgi:hypothetical protein